MLSKDVRVTIRLTDLNAYYLSKLGFLDLRTGRLRKNKLNFNQFANESLTNYMESNKNPYSERVNPKDLMYAHAKRELGKASMKVQEWVRVIERLKNIKLADVENEL